MTEYQYPDSARPELIEFLPKNYKTVLEIGCGRGGFKKSLDQNTELWGVEPNESAAKQAEFKGYKVLVGLYEEVAHKCPDDYFDLIVCNDVIEHMVDHEKFLTEIKGKMKSTGCLVGSIPNIRYYPVLFDLLFKKDWQYTEIGVLDKTHLRFFTEKSLIRTFESTDYTIQLLKGINATEKYWFTLRSTAKYLFINFPFGLFKDTRYMQFGFRVTKSLNGR